MTTIKSYTDLEQSRKLAEILPVESADMRYGYIAPYEFSDRMYDGGYDNVPYPKDFMKRNPNFSENEYDGEFPCWSLAALLEVMPQSIRKYDDAERCYKTYDLNLFRSYYYCCSYSFGPSLKEENHDNLFCYGGDTWLEAVFNMIVFLFYNGYMKGE